jgi:DNA polymerase-1
MTSEKPILTLIDGHALVFRAFYAFAPLTSPDGRLVNAVYGFNRMLLRSIKELHPEYIAVTFDMEKPTFRHTSFTGYKAQRHETPTELLDQLSLIKETVQALNIPIFGVEGFEADDVIGTIATQQASDELHVVIVTGDRDAFQLVKNGQISVFMPAKNAEGSHEFWEKDVEESLGLPPSLVIDYKSLAGDASDNIPGVRGVGPKTAVALLKAFGSLDALYKGIAAPDTLTAEQKALLKLSLLQKLVQDHENAFMSQKLATIDQHVPLHFELEKCRVTGYDKQLTLAMYNELNFKSLIPMLPPDEFEQGVQDALF